MYAHIHICMSTYTQILSFIHKYIHKYIYIPSFSTSSITLHNNCTTYKCDDDYDDVDLNKITTNVKLAIIAYT
jgi:hypothetical protein